MTGRVIASTESIAAPPASAVASTGLPSPPVVKEEMCRVTEVIPWNAAVVPPPATTASVHLRNGLTSVVIAEAVTRMPATPPSASRWCRAGCPPTGCSSRRSRAASPPRR